MFAYPLSEVEVIANGRAAKTDRRRGCAMRFYEMWACALPTTDSASAFVRLNPALSFWEGDQSTAGGRL
jgi:hypothetical protein